jgi:hypothetical protein
MCEENAPVHEEMKDGVESICRHEAGHWLAAQILGLHTNGIEIELNSFQPKGMVNIDTWKSEMVSVDQIETFLEKRIVELFCGAIAEFMPVDGKATEEDVANCTVAWNPDSTAGNDYAKITTLIHLLRNIRFPNSDSLNQVDQELKTIEKELLVRASELVAKNVTFLNQLTGYMIERTTQLIKYQFNDQELKELPGYQNIKHTG